MALQNFKGGPGSGNSRKLQRRGSVQESQSSKTSYDSRRALSWINNAKHSRPRHLPGRYMLLLARGYDSKVES